MNIISFNYSSNPRRWALSTSFTGEEVEAHVFAEDQTFGRTESPIQASQAPKPSLFPHRETSTSPSSMPVPPLLSLCLRRQLLGASQQHHMSQRGRWKPQGIPRDHILYSLSATQPTMAYNF